MWLEIQDALGAVMRRAVEEKKVAGVSVLLAGAGRPVVSLQCGYADREAEKFMVPGTVYRLHSMTKPVMAVAAAKLAENGKLDMERRVSDFFPAFSDMAVMKGSGPEMRRVPSQVPMRIYHLLNMTSGLVYPDDESVPGREMGAVFEQVGREMRAGTGPDTGAMAERFAACSLAFEPGRGWAYGVSADVLGAVIEKAAGMELGEFLKKEIFDPLEMGDTAFGVPAEKKDRLAAVYEERPEGTPGQTLVRSERDELGLLHEAPAHPAFASGGAGLCGTLPDYLKFADMLLCGGRTGRSGKERLLKRETVSILTGSRLTPLQQGAFKEVTMFSLGRYTYGGLMRKCLVENVPRKIARFGEYGWGGQCGTDFVNFPAEDATLLIGMQKQNARTYSLGKKLRGAVLAYLG